jgi:hypothetical protein
MMRAYSAACKQSTLLVPLCVCRIRGCKKKYSRYLEQLVIFYQQSAHTRTSVCIVSTALS